MEYAEKGNIERKNVEKKNAESRARRVDPDPIGSGSGSINFRYDER
jgi:hypothetical protein